MLNELSKLAAGMLFTGGHLAHCETVRTLADADTIGTHVPRPRRYGTGAVEWLMLVPVWIATPLMVGLAAAELLRHA